MTETKLCRLKKKVHLRLKTMDAKRVETISARVDAAVSSPGRTVAACFGAFTDNLVIFFLVCCVRSRVEKTSGKTPSKKKAI